MMPHTNGIHVDISKYPAWYTPPSLHRVSFFSILSLNQDILQATNDCTADQCFNTTNDDKQSRCNPYQLPIAPLYYAGPQCNNQVYTADEQQGPVHGEAEDVAGSVEVVRCGGANGKRPIEGREVWCCVAQGNGALCALDEAVGLSERSYVRTRV